MELAGQRLKANKKFSLHNRYRIFGFLDRLEARQSREEEEQDRTGSQEGFAREKPATAARTTAVAEHCIADVSRDLGVVEPT